MPRYVLRPQRPAVLAAEHQALVTARARPGGSLRVLDPLVLAQTVDRQHVDGDYPPPTPCLRHTNHEPAADVGDLLSHEQAFTLKIDIFPPTVLGCTRQSVRSDGVGLLCCGPITVRQEAAAGAPRGSAQRWSPGR
jgi:hypothetical protein